MTISPTPSAPSPRWSIAAFGVTILTGAFLLFQVQPLVSKAILPWFGGCPAVWTTCMLFFQVVLFAGYYYAHLLQSWLPPRRQAAVHLALVVIALALLPIRPGDYWRPHDASYPTWQILLLLTGTVGLPYFALSATSPLVQAWFSGVWPDRSPYRLYALSNAGSLVALLSYPFLFEPAFDLRTQSLLWSGLFLLYAVLCGLSLVGVWRCVSILPSEEGQVAGAAQGSWFAVQGSALPTSKSPNLHISISPNSSSLWLDRFRWLALPACASLMLLATTNHVCQDVAAVPFLWVIPLSLYLLSFIICFEHARRYVRWFWAAGTLLALAALVFKDYTKYNHSWGLPLEAALNFAAMFFVCMVCHGELARLKPNPRRLTEFYLMIAGGGALGGFFVSIVAPLIFRTHTYLEWNIGIVASGLLAVGLLVLPPFAGRRGIICYTIVAPLIAAGASYCFYWGFDAEPPVDRMRSFFGVVTVTKVLVDSTKESDDPPKFQFKLVHGSILHGCQFANPAKRHYLTTYYGETSGVGRAILGLQKSGPVRVAAVGLGVGTLAAYARPGDLFRFYEINDQVIRLAKKHFTYLADCRGKYEIKLGDARLSLESEPPEEKFNVIVVDAFSGDSIPTHLLTIEAFQLYQEHLASDGVIAVHVSNRYLRLAPVVRRLADASGMGASRIDDESSKEDRLQSSSLWVLVTRNNRFLKANPSDPLDWGEDKFQASLWTDQYSNLFQILTPPR
jgi:spermidine synthase